VDESHLVEMAAVFVLAGEVYSSLGEEQLLAENLEVLVQDSALFLPLLCLLPER
jgi:hypothetical protein